MQPIHSILPLNPHHQLPLHPLKPPINNPNNLQPSFPNNSPNPILLIPNFLPNMSLNITKKSYNSLPNLPQHLNLTPDTVDQHPVHITDILVTWCGVLAEVELSMDADATCA